MAMGFQHYVGRAVATRIVATDGTGDFDNIQDAIDDLPAGGGVVYIKEGTYTITTTISITSNNVSLIGAGKATIINSNASTIDTISVSGCSGIIIDKLCIVSKRTNYVESIKLVNCDNSVFSNLWISTNDNSISMDNSCTGNMIHNCNISNGFSSGIIIYGANNSITSNYITTCSEGALKLQGALNNVISNNRIVSNPAQGIKLIYSCNGNLISNNIVNSNGTSFFKSGIYIHQSDNNIIIGNTVTNNTNHEVNINDNQCDRNIIMGNYCKGTAPNAKINDSGTNTQIAHNITS